MSDSNNAGVDNATSQQEEFDIVWLIAYLWGKARTIACIIGGCVVAAIVIYACRPKVFTSKAAILPVMESSGSNLGGLKGLASMAGVNIGSMGSTGAATITPDLYTEVVTSTPALLEIMERVPLTWATPADTVMTLYEHMKADTLMTIGRSLKKYTIGLPGVIMTAIRGEKPEAEFVEPQNDDFSRVPKPIVLDKGRKRCAEWLRDRIEVSPDEETSLVRISAEGETPEQSAELATAVMQQIQTTITEYATSSAKKTLNFLQVRYDETMKEFTESRQEFFAYRDRHRDYVEERTSVERQQLEDKYNMNYSLLQTLQTELEKSRMELLAETPVFSVVEPVVQPEKKSSPKLLLHLIGGIMVGFVVSVGGLLLVLGYKQVFMPKEFKKIYDEYKVTGEA